VLILVILLVIGFIANLAILETMGSSLWSSAPSCGAWDRWDARLAVLGSAPLRHQDRVGLVGGGVSA
jgi:hypothetical protein